MIKLKPPYKSFLESQHAPPHPELVTIIPAESPCAQPAPAGNLSGCLWSIDNLFITTFGREFIEILEYILEQEDTIEMTKMEEEFGSGTVTDIGDLEDKADQIHRVLLTLTSGEAEDLMVGASNGFEAYRRVQLFNVPNPLPFQES